MVLANIEVKLQFKALRGGIHFYMADWNEVKRRSIKESKFEK